MEENEPKKEQKVISGPVKIRKKSEIRKIAEEFLASDIADIRQHIKTDVIIPAIKRVIFEAVNLFLYSDGSSNVVPFDSGKRNNTSYGSRYKSESERRYSRSADAFGLDDIVLKTRLDAENVLSSLHEKIRRYGAASVSDLYEALDETCPYTYNDYGWIDLRGARITLVRDGYLLRLPKALPID